MRILGITIPENKRLEIGLTTLFGVGRSRAQNILDKVKIDHGVKAKDLSADKENELRKIIEGLKIEGDLKREVSGNIKRLKDIKSYRGVRHTRTFEFPAPRPPLLAAHCGHCGHLSRAPRRADSGPRPTLVLVEATCARPQVPAAEQLIKNN